MKDAKQYTSIFKATSLIGGVQVFQVLTNLIRGKVIAILLGATGMGINSLFISTISMITNFTGLGLNFSAVREIAKAKESNDTLFLSEVITIFKKWLIASAVLALFTVFFLSPILSRYTFESSEYTLAFIFLASMAFFNILSSGNASILQGVRSLRKFALFNLSSSVSSLIVSIPFYFFMGVRGIVPALIISSLLTLVISILYTKSLHITSRSNNYKETFSRGMDMVKLGVTMMLSTTVGSIIHYLINISISSSSVADLGLYQAGMSITSQSIGLVFTAMAVDYYPRLSAISSDNVKVREMTNQQGVVTLLIATPVLSILSVMSPLVVILLLSHEFLIIVDFIRLIAFGILFKATSYSIGSISFAKGDKKVFFVMEGILMNFATLLFIAGGYKIGGLYGIGVGYIFLHILYLITIVLVTNKLYEFKISRLYLKIIGVSTIIMGFITALVTFNLFGPYITYSLSSIAIIIYMFFSFKIVSNIIDIKGLFNRLLRRG